jgi:TetR/AcrR family transcriptional regulator, transcriptional repressor of bet genes
MPAIVSHDKRRSLIATVVKRIVADSGMEAVTVRNVAREAGFSSTIVSHYFRNKRDLLTFTYGSIRTRAVHMIDDAFNRNADVLECFETLLPINKENLADWQAWFGFWGMTTSDPDLAAERDATMEATNQLLQRILKHAKKCGELPADLDTAVHARRLQMFINGLASFVVMSPTTWSPDKQRAALSAEIDTMRSMRHTAPRRARKRVMTASRVGRVT